VHTSILGGKIMATIYYFTGTGNSLHVARQIAEQLDAKLESIVSYMNEKKHIEDDLIGIVVPIYCMDIPRIVKKFLRDAKFAKKSYIFGVVTCGAIDGNALHGMKEILEEKGLQLSYGATIYLPDNSIVFPTDTQKKANMLKHQSSQVETICLNVEQRIVNADTLDSTMKHTLMSKCLDIGLKSIYKIKSKTISKSKCIQCGICEKVCPISAIQKENDTYRIANDCENCFACAHWCPARAISIGKLTPDDKTHYTHPNVTVHDIIMQKKK
jgi:ferredoxin/flavodoxin